MTVPHTPGNNGLVLLTGATGYVGGRLLRLFEDQGDTVRCLSRQPAQITTTSPRTQVMRGDLLDGSSLDAAFDGVESAYYLVHSMAAGAGFAEKDRRAAFNFGHAAARAGVRRIVYLGGLGGNPDSPSEHLKSRTETGDVLRRSGVSVIEFRASIVIGAGSLSYEIIGALVERLPVMICPRWVTTLTQPIAIDDVLSYLMAALDLPTGGSSVVEIGGPEVVSYGDMMRIYARLRGLRRVLIEVPVLTPRLSGLWLRLVTPAQATVGRALVEGLRDPTIVRSASARTMFAIEPMSLREAFMMAIDQGTVTRLKRDVRTIVVDAAPAQAFLPVRRIGGSRGWYFGNALWRLRGWLDRCVGGAGMPRGRADAEECAVGDLIDGWRIEEYDPDHRLRLSAGLKMPGRGWLQFDVTALGPSRSLLRLTATYDPRGVLGLVYWYAVMPAHALIFNGLLRRLATIAAPGPASHHPH